MKPTAGPAERAHPRPHLFHHHAVAIDETQHRGHRAAVTCPYEEGHHGTTRRIAHRGLPAQPLLATNQAAAR